MATLGTLLQTSLAAQLATFLSATRLDPNLPLTQAGFVQLRPSQRLVYSATTFPKLVNVQEFTTSQLVIGRYDVVSDVQFSYDAFFIGNYTPWLTSPSDPYAFESIKILRFHSVDLNDESKLVALRVDGLLTYYIP